ncbi:MAG: hypothetical protein KDA75_19195, partial [Planctomycetaceae bacterium]|nr:hypothetical protein [Planctomycetaceae bacterium]
MPQTIHIHNHPRRGGWWLRIVLLLLLISLVLNATQLVSYRDYASGSQPPFERFVDGELKSPDKIAVLEVQGIIMPPYSDRLLKSIERVQEDSSVRG